MAQPENSIQHIIRRQVDGIWWSRRGDDGTSWNLFLGPVKEADAIKAAMAGFLQKDDPPPAA